MAKTGYQKPDYYARRARSEGYAARSVFKLEDIDKKQKLFRRGLKVLDLGAAPGSWMQYAAGKVGRSGRVVGVDISPISRGLSPEEAFLQRDVLSMEPEDLKHEYGFFDLVLSDLAPKTTGHKDIDHFRSVQLAFCALHFAEALLRPGGNLLVKVFQGQEFEELVKALRTRFQKVTTIKPKGSRPSSREMFILGRAIKAEET
jgi:23S rRNA (uridine2552-2'-O)-methyltransferase